MLLLNLFTNIFNYSKIKSFQITIVEDYNKNWINKPWEDYAIDCVKLFSDALSESTLKSTTKKRKKEIKIYIIAFCGIRNKELDYATQKLVNMPIVEYKDFFNEDYYLYVKNIKNDDFGNVIEVAIEMSKVLASTGDKLKISSTIWYYIKLHLYIEATEEVYGEKLENLVKQLK